MSKQRDEWALVVSKQAELNRQRELEEIVQVRESKEGYKQDLQYQQQLRVMETEKLKRQRDDDARDAEQRARLFQQDSERRRLEELQQKRALAGDYQRQQDFQRQKEAEERQRKLREEQEQMERLRMQLESEARRKKEFKSVEAQREQDMLHYRRTQENAQRQASVSEKLYEQKLSQDYIEREQRKEQERRDYYQRIQLAQRDRVSQHLQSVTSQQQEKDFQVSQWITANQEQHQRRLAEKEEMEKRIRLSAIQEANQTLRAQMEEKEHQRQLEKDEARRQQEESLQRSAANKQWEEQRAQERRQQQAYYRDVLAAQSSLSQDAKQAGTKLTDHERMLNRGLLGSGPRNTLQSSAAQVLKSTTALDVDARPQGSGYERNARAFFGESRGTQEQARDQRRFPDPANDPSWAREEKSSFDANERAFYGDDGADGSAARQVPRSYDASDRHNPISNPIGERPPVPGDRPLYRARRAVF